jgi:hypothetical protein
MTTETSTDAMQEANVFFKDENGFRWHFKLQATNQMALQAAHRRACDFLITSNYTPDAGPSRGTGAGGAQEASDGFDPRNVKCGQCDGPTYFNETKRNPKGPDWTCKDKEGCNARAWKQAKDGKPGEWKFPAI